MNRRLILPVLMALNACVPMSHTGTTGPGFEAPAVSRHGIIADSTLPPMKNFAQARPQAPARANTEIAADFIELAFEMESGRALPVLTRFEGPISLTVSGAPPPALTGDLARLLGRLRHEAQIDIRQTSSPDANITIEAVSRAAIRAVLPQAACFVAPNVSSLEEFRTARRSPRTDWTRLASRRQLAIFVPNDVSPQETRDCLHEEIAQALGPLNDIYRLPDSVFNDDNVHTVLTGFDMLILRTYYDPALRSGMTRAQVAAVVPGILSRINPAGATARGGSADRTPRAWSDAIQTALGPGSTVRMRRKAAQDATRIAASRNWQDSRQGFAHYAMGRVLQGADPATAEKSYLMADHFYAGTPGTALHRAYIAAQLGGFALRRADGAAALRLTEPYMDVARQHENAALLATLMLIRAEALELENRPDEARSVRLDSIGWARYGFGPDWAVRAKLSEIASLNPRKG